MHAPRSTPPDKLPAPSTEERAHSDRLFGVIANDITRAGGVIPFSRYMELALYAPGLGYYSAGTQKFGAQGDFVTAPECSPVFARCLARQCADILTQLDGADILEAGAGSGALAADLLLALEQADCLPETYFIMELSTELRDRQAETLRARAPHLRARVQWLDGLPERGFRGVVLGNELLDAMPVERFRMTESGARVLGVAVEAGRFVWREQGVDHQVTDRLHGLELPVGYTSEINFAAEAWVRTVGLAMEAGVLLLIDYGFPRHEFYHVQRDQGTLMCHYRHRAQADPLILVGLQDITAHVDFTAIAEAGTDAGLSVLGYTSQGAFLLANGIGNEIEKSDASAAGEHLALSTQVKKLTLPTEMGELFKVIALGRGIDGPLRGFSLQDRRARL